MQVYTPEIKQAAYNLRYLAQNMAETIEELGKAKSPKDAEYLWNAYMHVMKSKTNKNFDESNNIVRDNINYWLGKFTDFNSPLRLYYRLIQDFVFNPDMEFVSYIKDSDYNTTRDDILNKQLDIISDFLDRADSTKTAEVDTSKKSLDQASYD